MQACIISLPRLTLEYLPPFAYIIFWAKPDMIIDRLPDPILAVSRALENAKTGGRSLSGLEYLHIRTAAKELEQSNPTLSRRLSNIAALNHPSNTKFWKKVFHLRQ